MATSDIVIMVLAGAGVLVVLGVAVIVSMLRANRDKDSAHEWLAAQQRAAAAVQEQRPVARVSPRPVSTTENDPTRELVRHRCPKCNGPAARGGDGLLRCLNRCRVQSMRDHRWTDGP